jgi:hypothetical protein
MSPTRLPDCPELDYLAEALARLLATWWVEHRSLEETTAPNQSALVGEVRVGTAQSSD